MANRFQRLARRSRAGFRFGRLIGRDLAMLSVLLCSVSAAVFAQNGSNNWVDVDFPRDSPVLMVSSSLGSTTMRPRGASMDLSLHTSLLLRNTGTKPICGLTLQVEAQDLTPTGKGSVMVSSLDVQPGEVFPVRIDMELLRPFNGSAKSEGPLVQVSLDCALYSDLTSYGPNRMRTRRELMVFELEARRDRRYLAGLLNSHQLALLREELNFGLEDLSPRQLGFEIIRAPQIGPQNALPVRLGIVSFASSPVVPLDGAARVAGNELRSPEVDVENRSKKVVRSIEMGWILRDDHGASYVAGSTPSFVDLGPVGTEKMSEPGTLRFSRPGGQPMRIGEVLTFVNNVEFADGKLWIPSREDIQKATDDPTLRRALASSPEQQRLAEIYRRKGLNALAIELRKP